MCIGWVNWTLPVSPKGMFMQISVWKNGPETTPKKPPVFLCIFLNVATNLAPVLMRISPISIGLICISAVWRKIAQNLRQRSDTVSQWKKSVPISHSNKLDAE